MTETTPSSSAPDFVYASAWQRFAASIIDLLVFAPVALLNMWVGSQSRESALVAEQSNTWIYLLYAVYCHAQFGKTVGKHVLRIRVVRSDGEVLGWGRATVRSGVDIVFSVAMSVGSILAWSAVTEEAFAQTPGWLTRSSLAADVGPAWVSWVWGVWVAWAVVSFVVLWANPRKRAPHDYFAGSFVVVEPRD